MRDKLKIKKEFDILNNTILLRDGLEENLDYFSRTVLRVFRIETAIILKIAK